MDKVEQVAPCAVGDTKHQATDKEGKPTGHRLCGKHFNGLADMLRAIEEEFDDVLGDPNDPDSYGAVPSIAIQLNTGGGSTHSSAPAFEQAPARLDPLVLTDSRQGRGDKESSDERRIGSRTNSVLVVLSGYADRVRAERGLTPPSQSMLDCKDRLPLGGKPHGPTYGLPCRHPWCSGDTVERRIWLPRTVATERQVLTRQLDLIVRWVATEDYPYGAGEVFTKLRKLLGQLRQANDTAEHPLGHCPVDRGDKPCFGPLWPVKPVHTVGEWKGSAPSAVRCEHCGTRWEGPGDLARLALILEQQRKPGAA